MTHVPRWRRYLRFWRPDIDRDIDDELRFHFESRIADLRALGLSAEQAYRQAGEEFGDESTARLRMREIDERMERRRARLLWLDAFLADLRYALRGIIKSPMLSAAVIVTLAVGIGATVTMYGVMRQLVLQPPPHIVDPERMVRLYFTWQDPGAAISLEQRMSYPLFEDVRTQERGRTDIVAYIPDREVPVGLGVDAQLASATMVSAGYWRTLGVRPLVGRYMGDEEAHPLTGARVAVLGHAFWQRRYGGDSQIVGRTIMVRGVAYEIIGVTPRGFRGLEYGPTDLWLPLRAYEDDGKTQPRWHRSIAPQYVRLAARLQPAMSVPSSEARLSHLYAAFLTRQFERIESLRAGERPTWGVRLVGVTGALDGAMTPIPEARLSIWLTAIAGILLAVACANVGGLLLLRALRRRREFAVRLALGMSRRRLSALLCTEGLAFAMLGGLAAAAIVALGGSLVRDTLIEGMLSESAGVDWSIVLLTIGCTLAAALVGGLAPLVQLRADLTAALRDGGAQGATRRSLVFRTLLITQTALSVVLLTGAGLFVRSIRQIDALDHGMDVQNVFALQADFTGTTRSPEERAEFFEQALARARDLPGVLHASLAEDIPLRRASVREFRVVRSGERIMPGGTAPLSNDVADDFVAATGMRLLDGRDFTAADRRGSRPVIVNASLARAAWPGQRPIGQCVYFTSSPDECAMVVGVVADARSFTLREDRRPWFYRALPARSEAGTRVLLVRMSPNAEGSERMLRHELQELDPAQPYLEVRRLDDALVPEIRPFRLGATVFTAFGVLATLLAAIGLYAAMAYAVTQRTREIGLRIAIGATRLRVVALVLRDGTRTALGGVALGLTIGVLTGPLIADLLFEVSPRDPVVLAGIAVGALLTAMLASLEPARRAAAVEPMGALRMD